MHPPERLPRNGEEYKILNQEDTVYTNGSCTGNGTAEARAGYGVWFGRDDDRNAAIRVPGKEQSNQMTELLAILHAVKTAPKDIPPRIKSDSKFAIEGLTENAREWEEIDWIRIKHGPLFQMHYRMDKEERRGHHPAMGKGARRHRRQRRSRQTCHLRSPRRSGGGIRDTLPSSELEADSSLGGIDRSHGTKEHDNHRRETEPDNSKHYLQAPQK